MKNILFAFFLLVLSASVYAQSSVGINASTWAGVSNVTWNPAIADSKYAADISLGVMSSGFNQNHIGFPSSTVFTNASFEEIFGLKLLNNEQWKSSEFFNSKSKNISQWAQIEGPGSFMFPFKNNKHAIAVSYHLNSFRTIHALNSELAQWASSNATSTYASPGSETFNLSQATWIDYDFTYSGPCGAA